MAKNEQNHTGHDFQDKQQNSGAKASQNAQTLGEQATLIIITPKTGWRWWLVTIVSILWSPLVVGLIRVVFNSCLLLSIALLLAIVFAEPDKLTELTDSFADVGETVGYYIFTLLPEMLLEQTIVVDHPIRTLISRLWGTVSLFFLNLELAGAMFICGLISGNKYALDSEKLHRSAMGLRHLTNLLSWPWMLVWLITAILFVVGFVLSVELALLVIYLAIFSLSFYVSCFFSQRTR